MKRLLTIGHSYVVSLNRSLMRALDERGEVKVTVLTPAFFHGDLRSLRSESEPSGSRLDVREIRCHLSRKIHFFFYNPLELRRYIREIEFDYCYIWEEPYIVSGFQVARELKALGKPYSIFTAQNLVKKYPWPFASFERQSLQSAQAVWPCGHLVNRCLEKKGFSQLRREVIPLPVDLEKFKLMSFDAKEMQKQKLGLGGKKVIGFMGRLTPEKGCRVLMRALDELLENPMYGALILGSGALESEMREWIRSRGFEDQVKLMSVVHSSVPTLLPAMDVLLCPSQPTHFWEEQFGRMIVEAMACGVPVVGSRSGEIPFVMADAGLTVEPQDVKAWVENAQKVLWQESFAQEMVKKGLVRAQSFSARALAPLVEKNILAALSNFK